MRMTTKVLAVALMSSVMASSAMAEGFFAGADLGTVTYPDYTGAAVTGAVRAGFASATAKQDSGSFTIGIHGGQWINENFGWEAGYADLGSVKGTVTTTGPAATGTYKYSASAFYAVALGGIQLGVGKLFGKAGLFSASTKLDEGGALVGSFSQSSTGLLIGGGYEYSFLRNLSGKAGLNLYNGVKFVNDFAAVRTTESKTLVQVGVGVDYKF